MRLQQLCSWKGSCQLILVTAGAHVDHLAVSIELALVFHLLAFLARDAKSWHIDPDLFPLLMRERIQLEGLLTAAAYCARLLELLDQILSLLLIIKSHDQ